MTEMPYLCWAFLYTSTGVNSYYFLKIINESVFLKKRKILEVVDRGDYQISQERDKKLFLDDQWDGIIIGNNVLLYNENKILSLFRYYERFRRPVN